MINLNQNLSQSDSVTSHLIPNVAQGTLNYILSSADLEPYPHKATLALTLALALEPYPHKATLALALALMGEGEGEDEGDGHGPGQGRGQC